MSNETTAADAADKTFKWGDFILNPADVPVASLHALAQRGFTHVLGNEVASALTAWKKTEQGAAATQTEVDGWLKARREAKIEQIMKGELGVRAVSSGPRATGLDAVIRTVAIEWLKAKLGKSGNKLPTGDKTVNVAGKDMTRDDLIDSTVARAEKLVYSPGVTIKAEAERRHGEQEGIVAGVDELFA